MGPFIEDICKISIVLPDFPQVRIRNICLLSNSFMMSPSPSCGMLTSFMDGPYKYISISCFGLLVNSGGARAFIREEETPVTSYVDRGIWASSWADARVKVQRSSVQR